MDYRSLDFVQDPTEDHLLVVAGSDGYRSNIRLVNNKDNTIKNFFVEEGKFTQVRFVKTAKNKITGFVAGSDKGNISIFSYPFYETVLDQITAHAGEVTRLILSPDNRYLFSTGTDGSLFIFAIGE